MNEQNAPGSQDPKDADPAAPGDEPSRPGASSGVEADDAVPGAPAAEPIEAEFEPADTPFRTLLDRHVSMPIALGLAAGAAVLGGVFGVVFDGGGASQAQVQRAVDARIEAFETRQQELLETLAQSGAEGGGVAGAALAGLETEIAQAQAALDALGDRLRVVEASRGNGDAASSLATELAALETSVAEARRLAQEAAGQAAGQTDAVAALGAELTTLAETVRAQGRAVDQIANASSVLAGRVTGAPAPQGLGGAGAAAALAFASLQEAALSGGPFATEVADARLYFPESEDLAALAGVAETGAPTPVELAARFRSVTQAARDAELPVGGGVVDRLGQAIAGLVTVRRLDAPETDSVGDVIVRAQRRLAADDLAGAAAELDRLTGAPRDAVEVWIAEARNRVEIETRINALRASISER